MVKFGLSGIHESCLKFQRTGGFFMQAILLVFFLASAISATAHASTPGEVEVGGYLREAKLNGFSGNTKKFSDYKGRPLIINVWASWCGPCRAEMGSLERLARRYGLLGSKKYQRASQ